MLLIYSRVVCLVRIIHVVVHILDHTPLSGKTNDAGYLPFIIKSAA